MKKVLLSLLAAFALLSSCPAHAQIGSPEPDMIIFDLWKHTDDGNIKYYAPLPTQDGIVYFNYTLLKPAYASIGSGLQLVGGVLSAVGTPGQVNSDWNATTGAAQILNKPSLFSGAYSSLTGVPSTFAPSAHTHPVSEISDATTIGQNLVKAASQGAARMAIGAGTSSFDSAYSSLTGVPSTFTPSAHTHVATEISDSTSVGRSLLTAASQLTARTAIGAGTSSFSGAYADLAGLPSVFTPAAHTQAWSTITTTPNSCSGYGILDCVTPTSLTSTLSSYATSSALTSGLATKFNTPTGTTAQYVRGDGSLATTPAASTFNFSQPTTRSLAVSTSYQASDNTKAAVLYPSYACTNATQVLASSACTAQVRMGTGTLTCSTGTVYYTQSLSVNLGLLLTQNSTNPVPIFLPLGGSFIICPTAGTFTITAVEQTAGF